MQILIPEIYRELVNEHTEYHSFVNLGGRSSGKTVGNVLRTVLHCEQTGESAVIVVKNDNSIETGIWETFKKILKQLGIAHKFNYRVSKRTIEPKHGGYKIIFKSVADNANKTKGLDIPNKVCLLWFEEIGEFDDGDFGVVETTVVRYFTDKSITLYSGNPPKEPYHWTRLWVDNVKRLKGYKIFNATFLDIYQLLNEESKRKIYEIYKTNPQEFKHTYMGDPEASSDLVYKLSPEHILEINTPLDSFIAEWCLAVDIGVSHDKTAIILMFRLGNDRIITRKVWCHDPKKHGEITVSRIAEYIKNLYNNLINTEFSINGGNADLKGIPHGIVCDAHDFGLTKALRDIDLPAVKVKNKKVYSDIVKGKTLISRNRMYFMNDRHNNYPCFSLINEMLKLVWIIDKETGKRVSNNKPVNNKFVIGEDDCENAWRYGHKYLLRGININTTLPPLGNYEEDVEEIR